MTGPLLDGDLIRRRRAELGLSSRAIASQLGVTGSVVTRLEAGDNHQDVTLGLVAKLARLLGVDIADLLATDERVVDDERDLDGAVAAIGSMLLEARIETPGAALRDSLGLSQSVLREAIDELDHRLRGVGMRVAVN